MSSRAGRPCNGSDLTKLESSCSVFTEKVKKKNPQQMQPCNNQHLALKWTAVTDEVHIWKICHGVFQVMNIHNLFVEIFSCSIVTHVWEIKFVKNSQNSVTHTKLKLQRLNSDRIIFNSKKRSLSCLPLAVIFLLPSLLLQCLQHWVL